MKRILPVLLAALLGFAIARADDVVTKTDGAKLRGTVISETPEEVKIKTSGGIITIPRDEVAKVEKTKDVFKELQERQATAERTDRVATWVDLARWCQEHELWAISVDCWNRVVKLDPDHADARFELGYRRLEGKWVTEGEYFRAKGYVQHEGRWVSKEDKEKLDAGLVKWGPEGKEEWISAAEAAARDKAAAGEDEQKRERGDKDKKPAAPGQPPAKGSSVARPTEKTPRGPPSLVGRRPPQGSDKPLTPDERKAAVEQAKAKGGWIGTHSSKYYDFFSNGPLDEVKKLASTMDLMCDEYRRIFAFKSEIGRPFPVWLFANQQEFMARTNHGPGVGGFYDGEKIVGFHGNLGALTTQTVLFHEGTHQFQGLVFGQNMWRASIWFIEGLAVYFEASEVNGKRLVTDVIPKERLANVKRAIASGEYTRLADLIRLEQRQFGAMQYAHAWSLIYFLCHGTRGGLERFKKYFEGVKEGKDGVKLFEELFDKPIQQVEDAWKQYVLGL